MEGNGITAAHIREHRAVVREFGRAYRRALRRSNVWPECDARCSSCCTHDQPPVARIEVEILMALIRRRPELADVPDKIAAQIRRLDALAASDPRPGITDHRGEFPCVFLDAAGACRVYEHRPLACVVAYSPRRSECERAVRENDFRRGAGWDLSLNVTAAILVDVAAQVSARTVEVVRSIVEDTREFRDDNGRPPLLLMALAILWSDETRAAIDAAARKAHARAGGSLA